MKVNKGFATISIVLIIIAVLAIGSIMYYTRKNSNVLFKNTEKSSDQELEKQNTLSCCGQVYVFVGKTKQDYSNFVWVTISNDKITGAPATNNIFDYKYITLHDEYITGGNISNEKIPINVAVTDYTKMNNFPPPFSFEEMYNLILDKNPFIELYKCFDDKYKGYTDSSINALNVLIDNNKLSTNCEKII